MRDVPEVPSTNMESAEKLVEDCEVHVWHELYGQEVVLLCPLRYQ